MGNLTTLLLAETDAGKDFVRGLLQVIAWIMVALEALLILYGVYIAYLFATATDEGKRRAAKNRLLKLGSSLLIILGLVMALQVIQINFTKITVSSDPSNNLSNLTGSSQKINGKLRTNPQMSVTANELYNVGKVEINGNFTINLDLNYLEGGTLYDNYNGGDSRKTIAVGILTVKDVTIFNIPGYSNAYIKVDGKNATFFDSRKLSGKEVTMNVMTGNVLPVLITCSQTKGDDVCILADIKLTTPKVEETTSANPPTTGTPIKRQIKFDVVS